MGVRLEGDLHIIDASGPREFRTPAITYFLGNWS